MATKKTKKKVNEKQELFNEEEVITEKEITKQAKKDFFYDIAPYLIIIFFVIIIRTFICTPVRVNGTSMYPTLHNGDNMLLYKLAKHTRGLSRFDIVVVNTDSGKLIKRIIGKPGETVRYKVEETPDGKTTATLLINGKEVSEDFIDDEAKEATCNRDWNICEHDYVLGDDEYFVMGDNRGNSSDSRAIGAVTYKQIEGIAEVIVFPFNRFGNVNKTED